MKRVTVNADDNNDSEVQSEIGFNDENVYEHEEEDW